MSKNKLATDIRNAIERDPRSLYRLAKDCDLPYSTIHRFATGEREDLILGTAWRICESLGLELRPKRGRR